MSSVKRSVRGDRIEFVDHRSRFIGGDRSWIVSRLWLVRWSVHRLGFVDRFGLVGLCRLESRLRFGVSRLGSYVRSFYTFIISYG
jgi:hypothetical protein